MIRKKIKLSFMLVLSILLVCFSTDAFAAQDIPVPFSLLISQYTGNDLKIINSTTGTFNYKIIDQYGKDITSKVPNSDLSIDAIVDLNPNDGSGGRAKVNLDPSTGTER